MLRYASDAIDILTAFYRQQAGADSRKRSKKPNKDGLSRDWWVVGGGARSNITDRDVAYLAAYVEIAKRAERKIYASGIPFDDDVLWLDQSVIATVVTHGCIELVDEAFKLTEKGREFVSKVSSPAGLKVSEPE